MSGWSAFGLVDLGDHLGVGVVARIGGWEVGGGGGRGGDGGDPERRGERERQGGGAQVHGGRMPNSADPGHPAMGLRRTGTREHQAARAESDHQRGRSTPTVRDHGGIDE